MFLVDLLNTAGEYELGWTKYPSEGDSEVCVADRL